MIELGVALTWGTRVLLIRDYRSPKDISTDISGQTWAEYSNDGINFSDPKHKAKLISMVERASRKKRLPV